MAYTFSLLGPFAVVGDGRDVTPSASKVRTLLAVLLLKRGVTVTPAELVDSLWSVDPPRTAAATLQTYVYKLRKILGDESAGNGPRLITTSGGYQLDVGADAVDVFRFADLGRRAARALDTNEPAAAVELAREALELWRGPPLGGLHHGERLRTVAVGLDESRIRIAQVAAEAGLRLGRHRDLLGELRELTLGLPLHEELHALLIEALRRSGLRSEALEVYQRLRRSLVAELGIDPSPALQTLQSSLLGEGGAPSAGSTPERSAGRGTRGSAPPSLLAPAQLPADIADFVGREHDLGAAQELLLAPSGTAARLMSVTGMPGVGKTAFAVRLCHRLRGHLDGGQLVARLRGSVDPAHGSGPVDPEDLLARFLRAAGFDDRMLPRDSEERADLFRTWSSSRRLLVLLDDAESVEQVLPLLPGGPACVVVLTSRRQLYGLAGIHDVHLPPLAPAESVAVLGAAFGRDVDHPTGISIAGLCGGLPLALRCVGARARIERSTPGTLLRQMRSDLPSSLVFGDVDVLGHLAAGGRCLDVAQRHALCAIVAGTGTGTGTGTRFTVTDAACVLDTDDVAAASVMFRLTELHLVDAEPDLHGDTVWFSIHPLIRLAVFRESASWAGPRPAANG